jgi:hypothetical protein
MGTLAQTAIVDYRLSFADQEKQTSLICFSLQQTNRKKLFCRSHFPFAANKQKLPFSVSPIFRIYTEKNGTIQSTR